MIKIIIKNTRNFILGIIIYLLHQISIVRNIFKILKREYQIWWLGRNRYLEIDSFGTLQKNRQFSIVL